MRAREESVAQHLAHEDEALVRRLADVEALVRHGSFLSAAASFGEARRALESHLWIEERTLFPAAASAGQVRPGPLRTVLREHEQLRLLLSEVSAEISRWDRRGFQRSLRRLAALLRGHHRRERRLVRQAAGRVGSLGTFLARAAAAEAKQRRAWYEQAYGGGEPAGRPP